MQVLRAAIAAALIAGCEAKVAQPVREAPETPAEAAKGVLVQYRQALDRKDGTVAVDLVTPQTLVLYESIRRDALTADRTALAALPLPRRMLALTTRHRVDPAVLREADGRGLLVHLVDRGWGPRVMLGDLDLGAVSIDGDEATVQLVRAGTNSATVPLRREGAVWKVALDGVIAAAEPTYNAMMIRSGGESPEAILRLVEVMTEKPATEALFDPPG